MRKLKAWKRLKFALPLGAAAGLVLMASPPQQGLAQSNGPAAQRPAFGVYDPNGAFADSKAIGIEHVYMPWSDVSLESLTEADKYTFERGRKMLLTMEPWSWGAGWTLTNEQLRDKILAGDYDGQIAELCGAVATFKSPVTIRWGHEMEASTGRYAWTNWSPEDYVKAYRHFVDACRKVAPNAKFMWSPMGEASARDYYPGDAYVDEVGITVFGFQAYDADKYGKPMSFSEHLAERYDLVKDYNKPVIVAEAGCAGDQVYVERCLHELTAPNEQFTQLQGVVYFNDVDPYDWEGHGRPDWQVPANAFDFLN